MQRESFVRSQDGTDLFVTTAGEGVPLVLCDGLGCDGFIWKRFIPAYESRYRIIHWNYRGHGRSRIPADLDTLAIPSLVHDLKDVLDAFELEKAVLLGHSMGCQVILEFAVTYPERAAALMPVCGSYGRPLDTFHDSGLLSAVFPHLARAAQRWPGGARGLWRRVLLSQLPYVVAFTGEVNRMLIRRADLAPYFEHLASMDFNAFMAMAGNANHHTVEEKLSDIRQPTLIVAGDRDSFTPVWVSRRMQTLIPGSQLLVVPGGTHVAPLEIPELVHLRMDRFLADHVAPLFAPNEAREAASAPAAAAATAAGGRSRRKKKPA